MPHAIFSDNVQQIVLNSMLVCWSTFFPIKKETFRNQHRSPVCEAVFLSPFGSNTGKHWWRAKTPFFTRRSENSKKLSGTQHLHKQTQMSRFRSVFGPAFEKYILLCFCCKTSSFIAFVSGSIFQKWFWGAENLVNLRVLELGSPIKTKKWATKESVDPIKLNCKWNKKTTKSLGQIIR